MGSDYGLGSGLAEFKYQTLAEQDYTHNKIINCTKTYLNFNQDVFFSKIGQYSKAIFVYNNQQKVEIYCSALTMYKTTSAEWRHRLQRFGLGIGLELIIELELKVGLKVEDLTRVDNFACVENDIEA